MLLILEEGTCPQSQVQSDRVTSAKEREEISDSDKFINQSWNFSLLYAENWKWDQTHKQVTDIISVYVEIAHNKSP